ncbi:MAG TPA: AlkA N-terminal domain-containing protein [Candidatus Krumholzibacteria bacterium]|nr:AlkA N-terminal domain-containing protein [Candidatus Krumholzibacteria bacterium]HPD72518.1 AlkA N-terminal domain-containing protein [Candidatus Krumholzibacteria bacterium]HRY40550.1 AlkA N-terminal domain-containing protein [Candidatus Krumholzibacteria bacterium]
MSLDHEICYRAVASRDPRFDGRFFTGVRSTGVYCRPVCPARTPQRKNCAFFPSAAGAEEAGFRPCRRCRPETSPGTPAWLGTSATVSRALRLIAEGALDDGRIEDLADRLGLTDRHVRRLFAEHLGASPHAVASLRRVHFARHLIAETDLPLGQIALSAGFGSVRRFNAAVQRSFHETPTALRRRLRHEPGTAPHGHHVLRLPYRPPYDWDALIAYLVPRALPKVERVTAAVYRRAVCIAGAAGVIEVGPDPRDSCLLLRVPTALTPHLLAVTERVRSMFDVGADPEAIADRLARDRRLARLARRGAGLRLPGAWDRFELAVRAVLGQQVTVQGATTLAGRLVAAYGERLTGADGGDGGDGPDRIFPAPAVLAEADLQPLGLTRARAATVRALAAAIAADGTLLDASGGLEDAAARLRRIPGIGDWTAQYVCLRALREPDAFPAGDLALRRAWSRGGALPRPVDLTRRAEAWRPWRGYAALWLWQLGLPRLDSSKGASA